jgi:hypothetical protein
MAGKREWQIIVTTDVKDWLHRLEPAQRHRVAEALDVLAHQGPALGRRLVDRISGSRYHNMKELRPTGGHLRVLFAFDKQQRAVMLVGGDKTGQWNRWYHRNVRRADRLLGNHHRKSGEAYVWQTKTRTVGPRLDESSR